MPAFAGGYDTPGSAGSIALAGAYAYLADDENGLVVLDVASPASPQLVRTYNTPAITAAVGLGGSRVAIGLGGYGLQLLQRCEPE